MNELLLFSPEPPLKFIGGYLALHGAKFIGINGSCNLALMIVLILLYPRLLSPNTFPYRDKGGIRVGIMLGAAENNP